MSFTYEIGPTPDNPGRLMHRPCVVRVYEGGRPCGSYWFATRSEADRWIIEQRSPVSDPRVQPPARRDSTWFRLLGVTLILLALAALLCDLVRALWE